MIAIITLEHRPDGWRWNMTDPRNAETIGASTQGYTHRGDCYANLDRVTGLDLPAPRTREKVIAYRLEEITGRGHRAERIKVEALPTPTPAPAPRRARAKSKAKRKRSRR